MQAGHPVQRLFLRKPSGDCAEMRLEHEGRRHEGSTLSMKEAQWDSAAAVLAVSRPEVLVLQQGGLCFRLPTRTLVQEWSGLS